MPNFNFVPFANLYKSRGQSPPPPPPPIHISDKIAQSI